MPRQARLDVPCIFYLGEIMMKKTLSIIFLFIVVIGCRLYSWKVLENPEFPEAMLPTDLKPDILKKYTVGEVTVHPRIVYTDGNMTKQKLFIVFFSKTNSRTVSIKALSLSVDDVELKYGDHLISKMPSEWRWSPANAPFLCLQYWW